MKRTITFLLLCLSFQLPAQCWEKITAGSGHSAGIKADGTLWAWGDNTYGQLGDGTTVKKNTPKQIGTANNWLEVTAGYNQTFAIKTDGTLWAWGQNEYYQLGDGTNIERHIPTRIGTAANWVKVGVGYNHGIAKKSNGTIWGWGANFSGEIGDGTSETRSRPVQIGTATNWSTIECGMGHTLATKTNGTLWGWGINGYGRLGDGTTTDRNMPVQIGTDTHWVDAAGGDYHSIGLKSDGSIWCWGYNLDGQIGDGTPVNSRLVPTRVGADNMWMKIVAGRSHTLAIGVGGDLWAWGDNSASQLAGHLDENLPRRVGTSQEWTAVAAGSGHTLTLTEPITVINGQWITQHGVLKVFGGNSVGQLGDGTYTLRDLITTIACPASATLETDHFEAANALKIYPNPVQDILNVSFNATIGSLTLYNMLGQQVITKTMNAKEGKMDISNLNPGTYFAKVSIDSSVKTFKVIKE